MIRNTKIDRTDVNFLVPTALGNVLSDFLTDRDVAGCRPATLAFYRNELKPFMQWLGEMGVKSIEEISAVLLRAYFLDMRKHRHQNGVHKNFTVVRTWLLWAWGEYDQPTACPILKVTVDAPKFQQKPAIAMDAFSTILDACKGENQARDRAILLFLIDTGIRRAELARLKLSALQPGGMVQLEADGTKTGEPRKVFLVRETQRALKAYLKHRGNLQAGAPIFATEEGEPFTASGLRQVIRRACDRAGIPEQGMHKFRRGFALESKRAGADLVSISKQLGHKKVETTKRYLPLEDEDLRQVHERTSPINKLKKR
jgi:integrase/recombinase XerD